MDYSTDQLARIHQLAKTLTPLTEIGALMDVPISCLSDDVATEGHPARQAFYKGMAEASLEIRERDIELAKAGSPAAADALREYLRKMLNEL